MGSKQDDMNQKCTVNTQLKDPEPELDADKVPHPTTTKNQHQPVQDLMIYLRNPDISPGMVC